MIKQTKQVQSKKKKKCKLKHFQSTFQSYFHTEMLPKKLVT